MFTISKVKRLLCIISGLLCVALAVAGAFLPLLPTTPFLILAVGLFSRSSERMHQWLLKQKTLGPHLRDWEEHRAISLKGKRTATLTIMIVFGLTLFFVNIPMSIKLIVLAFGAIILAFIWTRPDRPHYPGV